MLQLFVGVVINIVELSGRRRITSYIWLCRLLLAACGSSFGYVLLLNLLLGGAVHVGKISGAVPAGGALSEVCFPRSRGI